MTDCPRCGEMIQGKPFLREEKTAYIIRDGKRDPLISLVYICKKCHRLEKKWQIMAGIAVFVILGVLAMHRYFFENIEAPGQETIAVTAVAPKATAPRLIPPGK